MYCPIHVENGVLVKEKRTEEMEIGGGRWKFRRESGFRFVEFENWGG